MARKPVLGIDFGTSNTSAAYVDTMGKLRVVPISNVDNAMPTVIWYAARDKFVIGGGARQKIVDDPINTITGFKRLVGRPFKSEFVNNARSRAPYKIVEADDGMAAVEVHGETKPIPQLIFLVIQRMLELANATSGMDFDECVLSVPAHYGHRQRAALRTAAEMAGLDVLALVNEPTAAALYFAKNSPMSNRALVFDLGGGTFDATLIQTHGNLVKVLASAGDAFLGGNDFDERIATSLARRFSSEHGVDLMQQKVVYQRLLFASEMAKIILSTDETATVRVMFAAEKEGRPLDLEYTLNRQLLDVLIAPLVEKCLGVCEDILKRTGLKPEDVGEVILVGGQTRTQSLRRRIYTLFPGDPNRNLTPELSVATGAALLGSLLDAGGGPPLADVLSVPIWVMTPGRPPQQAIAPSTAVPGVGRVVLDGAAAHVPLALLFYEALEPASTDREILGSARVEPDWMLAHNGVVSVEVMVTQSYSLDIAVRAQDGARLRLELTPPKRK